MVQKKKSIGERARVLLALECDEDLQHVEHATCDGKSIIRSDHHSIVVNLVNAKQTHLEYERDNTTHDRLRFWGVTMIVTQTSVKKKLIFF